MFWLGYSVESFPDGSFRVAGDTEDELIEKGLYKPGDVFIVDDNGILRKSENLMKLLKSQIWT